MKIRRRPTRGNAALVATVAGLGTASFAIGSHVGHQDANARRRPTPPKNLSGIRLTNAQLKTPQGLAVTTNDDHAFEYMSKIATALDLNLVDIRPLGRKLSHATSIGEAVQIMNQIGRIYGFDVEVPTTTSLTNAETYEPVDRSDPTALRDVLYDLQDIAATLQFVPIEVTQQSDFRHLRLVQTLTVQRDTYLQGAAGSFSGTTIMLTRHPASSASGLDVGNTDSSKAFSHEFGHSLQNIINRDPRARRALNAVNYHPDIKANDQNALAARTAAAEHHQTASAYSDSNAQENTANIVSDEIKPGSQFGPEGQSKQTDQAVVHALNLAFPGMAQYLAELRRTTNRSFPYRAFDYTDCINYHPKATELPNWQRLQASADPQQKLAALSNVVGTLSASDNGSLPVPVIVDGKRLGTITLRSPTFLGICETNTQAQYQFTFSGARTDIAKSTSLEIVAMPSELMPLKGVRPIPAEIVQAASNTVNVTVTDKARLSLRITLSVGRNKTVDIRAFADVGSSDYPTITDATASIQTTATRNAGISLG